MSLWITCGPTVLPAGKNFEADFTAKSAAAPESMGAAMLVPLSSRVVFTPAGLRPLLGNNFCRLP
jgi:hypothetical protein